MADKDPRTRPTSEWSEDEFDDMTEVVASASFKMRKKYWWVDVDDLQQQAWATVLRARETWKPGVGVPLDGYLHRALQHALRDYIWKQVTPASVPQRRGGVAFDHQRASVPHNGTLTKMLDERPAHANYHREDVARPDEIVARVRWIRAVKAALSEVLGNIRDGHLAQSVLLDETKSAEVAKRHGVDVRRVYAATRRAQLAIENDYGLMKLWRSKP